MKFFVRTAVIFLALVSSVRSADSPKRAPEFAAKNLAGESVSLRAQRGKLVFLSFFAGWCAPCRAEAPMLNALAAAYPETLRIFAIGYQEDDPGELRQTAADFGLKVPVLIGAKETLIKGYAVTGLPTGILIDEFGYVVKPYRGFTKKGEEELKGLVAEGSKRIEERKKKGLRLYLGNFTGNGEAPAKVRSALESALRSEKLSLVSSKEESTLSLAGSVSDLGAVMGVELVLSEPGGKELSRERASVISGNYELLTKSALKAVREWDWK
ncbi:MAG: TlpA disulfide reductase family protein [Bdellovibrionota bacterium]